MTEHDEGILQGMLDQASADIPALRDLERWATVQYHRAEALREDLDDSWHSRNRLMVLIVVQFFVIAILVAALAARW